MFKAIFYLIGFNFNDYGDIDFLNSRGNAALGEIIEFYLRSIFII